MEVLPDVTMEIYEALKKNEFIKNNVEMKNIKFFEYPEAQSIQDTFIVIDPLDEPTPKDFADNDNLTHEYFYQIDVFVKHKTSRNARFLCTNLTHAVERTLRHELGFGQTSSAKPEYNKDFNFYRGTRRFEGKKYYKL